MVSSTSASMSATEKKAAFSLAGIFALRMFGLFLIMPVFAIYAGKLDDVTPVLVGLAIGVYGLTQALFQIPFGMLSDRIGRKPVIIGGLLLFAIGSVIAASGESIYTVIIGRAIQGSGAIAAAVMALAADLTRETHRTKAMAIIGMSIGLSFALSLVAGPLLGAWIGISGIFWMTAVLALCGIGILALVVPTPVKSRVHRDAESVPGQFARVLSNSGLLRLDFGIFVLHMVMTSLFISYPLMLRDSGGLAVVDHWMVYLPVLLVSIAIMVPFIIIAERRNKMKPVFLGAVSSLAVAQAGLGLMAESLWGLVGWLLLYFAAFNLLEATLPSLISRIAPADSKGTAMGVYSTSQFFGAFLGGLVGGWVFSHHGSQGVMLFGAVAVSVWLLAAVGMQAPLLKTRILKIPEGVDDLQAYEQRLNAIEGVEEVVIVAEESVAYLKVNSRQLDTISLEAEEASA